MKTMSNASYKIQIAKHKTIDSRLCNNNVNFTKQENGKSINKQFQLI